MSDQDGAVQPPADQPPVNPQHAGGPPVFRLATWVQRVMAFIVDGGIAWLFVVIGSALAGGKANVVYLVAWLLSLAFWAWNMYTQGQTGQSVGKRVIGLRLVTEARAEPIGGVQSLARSVLHVVDAIPCYLGFLWPLWDEKRQTFADKIARSVVVTTR
jgi:uncharacterized RDD family membrane protein YckC